LEITKDQIKPRFIAQKQTRDSSRKKKIAIHRARKIPQKK